MSFLDALSHLNPLKKKDDLGLPIDDSGYENPFNKPLGGNDPLANPLSGHHEPLGPSGEQNMHNPDHGMNHDNFGHDLPQDDPRMGMPLGDSLRKPQENNSYEIHDEGFQTKHDRNKHNPLEKDLELISSKLDYLKASLEAVNQRLANLEQMTKHDIEQRKW